MTRQESFGEEEPLDEEASASWRPPVHCPQCHGIQTRFLSLQYEMSVYECDECGVQFETEEEV